MKSHEVLTLIEEITRLDGTKYMEISNMVQNGRAELAAERGYIKQVRILQLNIPHSPHVEAYETTLIRIMRCRLNRWITSMSGKSQPKFSMKWT